MEDALGPSVSQDSRNSLKRDHDSFALDDLRETEKAIKVDSQSRPTCQSPVKDSEEEISSIPTPPVSIEANKHAPSPGRRRRSSTNSLSDAGSRTPSLLDDSPMRSSFAPTQTSPSKSAFTVLNGNIAPPPKRSKLTFAEKEARRIEKEFKDQARAAEKAKKEADRQAHAEERSRKDAEKEAERKKKEAEKEEKRLAQEAEKVAKEERKRKKEEERRLKEEEKGLKEEEKQRAEEEKKKKNRGQKKLNAFFRTPTSTIDGVRGRSSMSPVPSRTATGVVGPSPAVSTTKEEASTYDRLFPAFFVQNNVTMAPINRFQRDQEAGESIEKAIDSYIVESRSPGHQRSFDAVSMFHLSGRDNVPRGKRFIPVREIMAELSGNSSRPIDLTTDSQNSQIRRTGDLLKKIPMKFLKFQEDVRPPYRGTFTKRPVHGMTRLARNPLRRDLPDTNYDYDSEAEWIEDEDAEDLNSEGEEEEDMGEDADDMDGFLDDSGVETAHSRRMLLQGDLEHTSTGLCWEDHHKRSTNVKMMPYRMEVILGKPNLSVNIKR